MDEAVKFLTNYLKQSRQYKPVPGTLITDRVKQLVRMRGPVIPSQISKEIGTNILMASAILSELASSSDVRISSVKFGGTPLYYVAGQEAKLQNYIASLPQKEKEAFEQLKAASVLRDSQLEPAIRVALRQIKDFAKPIDVAMDGETELFWKWYLLSNETAELAIKKIMGVDEGKSEQMNALQAQVQQTLAEARTEAAAATEKPEIQAPQPPPEPHQPQAHIPLAKRMPRQKASQPIAAEFARQISDFFAKNSIELLSEGPAKKAETEFIALLPSPVGKLKYFCVVKNKKTCTDSDISFALVQGQLKKLPVLLLTKGELTKKAQELLSQEIGAIVVKKI